MAEAEAPCSPTEHPQSSEDRKLLSITVPRKRTKDFAQTPCSLVDVFIFKSQFRKYLASRCLPSLGFPGGSAVKNPPVYAGDAGSIPGSGRSPGEGNGYPFKYSCLKNSMDRGAWRVTVLVITKSWT